LLQPKFLLAFRPHRRQGKQEAMDLKHSYMGESACCFASARGCTPPPPQIAVQHEMTSFADKDIVGAETPLSNSDVLFNTPMIATDVWKTLGQTSSLADSQQQVGQLSDKDDATVDEHDRNPSDISKLLQEFPPPPQPHWMAQSKWLETASAADGSVNNLPASNGTVGHPDTCAAACRYHHRKGGCRLGTSCPQCHLCFWQRTPPTFVGSQPWSAGTAGHPDHCGQPCKFARRKIGCHLGAACPQCHVCQWQRLQDRTGEQLKKPEINKASSGCPENAKETLSKLIHLQLFYRREELAGNVPSAVPASTDDVDVGDMSQSDRAVTSVSVGSIGHPASCGVACKHSEKTSDCKDGLLCSHCHLCTWQVNAEAKVSDADDAEKPELTIVASLGSVGHPECCHKPCKYVRRKGGCRNGPRCMDCHLCRWSRKLPGPETATNGSGASTEVQP